MRLYRWFFINPNASSDGEETNDLGEAIYNPKLICFSLMKREQVRKPIEIQDAQVLIPEQQILLRGSWQRFLLLVEDTHIAFCPETEEYLQILSSPVDRDGSRTHLDIYCVRNTEKEIDKNLYHRLCYV